jgi:DNA-binding response OmpR family regulator
MAILLIEDDIDLGNLLTQYLEMNNIEVIHARDGKTALWLFESEKFDLAVIDVMLPDTNGFEIARILKNQKTDVPFLFLTARNKKEDIIQGLKLGADDYITKPFEPEELVIPSGEKERRYHIGIGGEGGLPMKIENGGVLHFLQALTGKMLQKDVLYQLFRLFPSAAMG